MPDDDKWLESLKALEQRWAQESAPVTDVRAFVSSILKSHNLSNDAINKRYLPVLLEEIAFEGITDSAGIAKIVVAEIKTREKRIRDSAPFKSKPDPDNLDDWFPRGEKMSTNPSPTDSIDPDGDAPVRPAAHWSQDEDKVMKFWLSADKVHKTRNISLPVRPELEAFMLKTYGSAELSGLPIGMKGAELLAEYGKYLDNLEKKDEARETEAPIAPPPPPPPPPVSPKPSEPKTQRATPPTPPPTLSIHTESGAAWELKIRQAEVLIRSGFLPNSLKTPEQVITIMLMGEALGLHPMVALNNINVIQGKPTVSPQLMLALARRSGELQDLKIEDDGKTCAVTVTRRGQSPHTETFGMDDAQKMQLSSKDNWQKQPKTMRKWRTLSAALRIVFPDIIWGMYTTEELDPDSAVVED